MSSKSNKENTTAFYKTDYKENSKSAIAKYIGKE